MNDSFQIQIPKYHRIMTVLAEVACVCLIIATLLVGLTDAIQQARYSSGSRNDSQSADTNTVISIPGNFTGSFSGSVSGSLSDSLEGDYSYGVFTPGSAGSSEAVTDENGKTYYHYYVGGQAGEGGSISFDKFYTEATTDENGNVIFTPQYTIPSVGENGNVIFAPMDQIYLPDAMYISYTSAENNIFLLLGSFLPCVLLLLYTLYLYQKPKANRLVAAFTGIYALSFVPVVGSYLFSGSYSDILTFLTYGLISAAVAVLLGIMAVLLWKGIIKRKLVLATFILAWLYTGFSLIDDVQALLSDRSYFGVSPVVAIGYLLCDLGMLAFQVALFVYAYRKEEAAPTDTLPDDTAESGDPVSTPA